jgi:alkylation response protein AidB-like acyl-CoA dehydrogenase
MAVLTEDQAMLRDMASAWVRECAPIACARRAWEGAYPAGYDAELYAEMASMGWTAMVTPEAYGGAEFGYLGMGLVAEELGRTLAPTPLLASALTAASLIADAGSEAQKEAWLPRIASGEIVATLALEEGAHHDPAAVSLRAVASGAGWRLDGVKRPVAEGMGADLAVVVARTSGVAGEIEGLSLFLAETTAEGLQRQALRQIDGRGAAVLTLTGVDVGADALMGEAGSAWSVLERALDRTRAVLAAEMLGSSLQAFEVTLEHLKTRVQFGRVIGEFQALQHRAAAIFGELELTRSAVEAALQALDAGAADAPRLVSLAKAMAGDTFRLVANEMVQMHGGIGMTAEHDAGLYLKRARTADVAFGGAAFHRERWARLSGF